MSTLWNVVAQIFHLMRMNFIPKQEPQLTYRNTTQTSCSGAFTIALLQNDKELLVY